MVAFPRYAAQTYLTKRGSLTTSSFLVEEKTYSEISASREISEKT